jgi:hypothetical protein
VTPWVLPHGFESGFFGGRRFQKEAESIFDLRPDFPFQFYPGFVTRFGANFSAESTHASQLSFVAAQGKPELLCAA